MTDSKLHYVAFGPDAPGYGLLSERVLAQWAAIEEAIRMEWKKPSPEHRYQPTALAGCLEKLNSSLLQARRLKDHEERLLENRRMLNSVNEGQCIAIRGSEVCSDFEGLLLQGRASLDRLARFIGQLLRDDCSSFRKIGNVLQSASNNKPFAKDLHNVIVRSSSWFDKTFGQLSDEKALRDLVGHLHSLTEGVTTCFAIHKVGPTKILVLDCEIKLPGMSRQFPVLLTARDSVQWLSYIALNCAAIVSGIPTLEWSCYRPEWPERMVALSKFAITEPHGSLLGSDSIRTVRNMTPDGFTFFATNVGSSLFDHAIALNKGQQ
jgi:hypothetical protein